MTPLKLAIVAAIAAAAGACTDPAALAMLTKIDGPEPTAPIEVKADASTETPSKDDAGTTLALSQDGVTETRTRTRPGVQTTRRTQGGNSVMVRQIQR